MLFLKHISSKLQCSTPGIWQGPWSGSELSLSITPCLEHAEVAKGFLMHGQSHWRTYFVTAKVPHSQREMSLIAVVGSCRWKYLFVHQHTGSEGVYGCYCRWCGSILQKCGLVPKGMGRTILYNLLCSVSWLCVYAVIWLQFLDKMESKQTVVFYQFGVLCLFAFRMNTSPFSAANNRFNLKDNYDTVAYGKLLSPTLFYYPPHCHRCWHQQQAVTKGTKLHHWMMEAVEDGKWHL